MGICSQRSTQQLSINDKSTYCESPLKNNRKIQEVYQLSDLICKGTKGNLRKCIHIFSKSLRVVKIVQKTSDISEVDKQRQLIDQMKQLDHPSIIKVYEFFENEKEFYIIMDYCEGGDLFNYNKQTTYLSHIFKQIFSALVYLHNKNLQHNDLKPEKILFTSKTNFNLLQINCLNISIGASSKQPFSIKSSIYYQAPEVLLKKQVGRKANIWSCGIMLYQLLCDHMPFNETIPQSISKQIMKGVISFDSHELSSVSIHLKDLLKDTLRYHPNKRITAKQALQNHWISKSQPPNQLSSETSRQNEKQYLKQMLKYKPQSHAQSSIAGLILKNLNMKEEKEKMSAAFEMMDKDNDGQLTLIELVKGFKTFMSNVEAEVEAKIVVEQFGDKNGVIGLNEFLTATMEKNKIKTDENLKQAFEIIDQDRNGYITVKELQIALKYSSDLKEIQELFSKYDNDDSSKITFNEFKQMMQDLL